MSTAGEKFRAALKSESPLQIIGTINANHALLAKRAGYRAIYLSGGGVAAGSLGVPDLGITTLEDVLVDVRRITAVCDLPLLVDIDTGFGPSAFNIQRTIKSLIDAGAAAVHMEDQIGAKRCGHRPNKEVVSTTEMVDRIKAAVIARGSDSLYLIARTDAVAIEGLDSAIARAKAYIDAGADAIFAEAIRTLDDYKRFTSEIKAPVLANITEFGLTPLFTLDELKSAGIAMALYPLSAFRAMNKAAERVYEVIRKEGTQKTILSDMQTREELYDRINYYEYENSLDKFQAEKREE
ncbi:MAG: methylisocitrate lyase [Candidatus Nanopelagicaceae bacterium]|nr:methylisocitrate lyase [Actinomycetota bacterium]NCV83470.1 methylisocitrate lyase [Actinomycetota bacterium]NCV96285.1 methylisocitrate lyase [Actinomycetota bacterium]NCX00822.1 methylisocitrate lyase [Actinomycetota bacterium]NCX33070.1 methylisocitrate lyase [Actinomycetota bacterium]